MLIMLVGNQLLWVEKENAEEKRAKKAVRRENEVAGADKQIFLAIFVYDSKTCQEAIYFFIIQFGY